MLKIKRGAPTHNTITVPGDKSISHRVLMLTALSDGACEITNLLCGEDCLHTVEALRGLGVSIELFPEHCSAVVHGCSGKLRAPKGDIHCGNSGTTMRLLAGILAAQPFCSRLVGDPSLSRRPMKRIIEPLSLMGAKLSAEGNNFPPLLVEGKPLQPITYQMPVASAQVKSAILLAGLFAQGKSTVIEYARSRDHTERMLQDFAVAIQRHGREISLKGPSVPQARNFCIPGDISSASFWTVAVAAQPGANLLIENVGLNPSRRAVLDILSRMGACIRETSIGQVEIGEPSGSLEITGTQLRATTIQGEEISNAIDEIPIIAVAGALAQGKTVIRNAQELRVKETDRITALTANLRAMGVGIIEHEDGMEIQGRDSLIGTHVKSFGDHRIAMAFSIAGLFATGETVIEDTSCIATSYPGFEKTLQRFSKGIVIC
ncbi:3-phosphoshikimate 1-carboxyvinyltransferase [Candidatus Xiphinematobacter sp. Idaho Grape]|uniref:3-phosphoshikimate 1-carboxyvinyltransferase n=1 Tax=Candidatus Xiphinematobacter sp. Idaho Grape TaxID=1704307 RepID=UPI000705E114|nr:3-phosphoshikimate 1-carboxyvinyltransferase [Candidatus Xiphinematobacter sp. Idaho Grape]ALJ56578.1 3-phosphoshikimate 1-carboxyvinyltransferase [Candidatus Xiphinematobacter sp. Idaho Grape]